MTRQRYHRWLFPVLALWMVGAIPSLVRAEASAAFSALDSLGGLSRASLSISSPTLGHHRLLIRQTDRLTGRLLNTSLSRPDLGFLRQYATADTGMSALIWVFAITFLVADVATIGGNIFALFTRQHRLAWGILGIAAGTLSLVWGFFPLFTLATMDIALPLSLTLWIMGVVPLLLGILSLTFRMGRGGYHHRHRGFRRYGIEFNIEPLVLPAGPNTPFATGYALTGTF